MKRLMIDIDPGRMALTLPTRSQDSAIRVMLLISDLDYRGAERQVIEIANNLDATRFEVTVCSLSSDVPLAVALKNSAETLCIVEKKNKYDISLVWRVSRLMKERRIDVVHAFLFDAEMVARLAGRLAGVKIVIASERNTDYRRSFVQSICQKLTRPFYDCMVSNSIAGKRFNMRTLSLPSSRIYVVYNGVDTTRFSPGNGSHIRREFGIAREDNVIGMVASFKRQKQHGDFFRMAKEVLKRFPNTWFLCVGVPLKDNQQGADEYHAEVMELREALGIKDRVLLLGNRTDMPYVYRACDITMLTSSREGTPNVLLESMACGVPVVATDVADNRYVVPDAVAGFVVPLGGILAMTDRVSRLLSRQDFCRQMGRNAREWVGREFSLKALVRRLGEIYTARWCSR